MVKKKEKKKSNIELLEGKLNRNVCDIYGYIQRELYPITKRIIELEVIKKENEENKEKVHCNDCKGRGYKFSRGDYTAFCDSKKRPLAKVTDYTQRPGDIYESLSKTVLNGEGNCPYFESLNTPKEEKEKFDFGTLGIVTAIIAGVVFVIWVFFKVGC